MSNIEEIWKTIDGYEHYQVSNLGRVKSLDRIVKCGYGKTKRHKGRILKPAITKSTGYEHVDIQGKHYNVHRLVATAFIENAENKSELDHINCIRVDNRVENLRWTTRLENARNPLSMINLSTSHIGIKQSKGQISKRVLKLKGRHVSLSNRLKISYSQPTRKDIEKICKQTGRVLFTYISSKYAAMDNGVHATNIRKACRGELKTAGGFKWRYAV